MVTKKPVKETAKAAAAFSAYCALGPSRSLQKLADSLNQIRPKDSPEIQLSTLKTWSAKWNWQKRLIDWETEQAKLALAEMTERQAELSKRGMELASQNLIAKAEKKRLGDMAAVVWLKNSMDAEFRARGGAEVKRVEHTGKDGDPIQINHVAATADGTLLTLNLAECTEDDKKLLLQVAENIRKRKDAERTDH